MVLCPVKNQNAKKGRDVVFHGRKGIVETFIVDKTFLKDVGPFFLS